MDIYNILKKLDEVENKQLTNEAADGPFTAGQKVMANGKPAVIVGQVMTPAGAAKYYSVRFDGKQYPGNTADQVHANQIEAAVSETEELDEAWPGTPEYELKFGKPEASSAFDKKKVSTGTVYTRKYQDEPDAEDDTPKKAGRPVGSKRSLGAKLPSGKQSKIHNKGAIAENTVALAEGQLKNWLHQQAEQMEREEFIAKFQDLLPEAGEFWDACCGDLDEANYSAKAARAGKDIGKPGKNFAKIAKGAAERYGSKERGEKVAGAVLNKLRHPSESIEETAGQWRVILKLHDDSAAPGETAERKIAINVTAGDEKSAIAMAKQKLLKSPRHDGSRIVGAKATQGVEEAVSPAQNKNVVIHGNRQGYYAWTPGSPILFINLFNGQFNPKGSDMTDWDPNKPAIQKFVNTAMKPYSLEQMPPDIAQYIQKKLSKYMQGQQGVEEGIIDAFNTWRDARNTFGGFGYNPKLEKQNQAAHDKRQQAADQEHGSGSYAAQLVKRLNVLNKEKSNEQWEYIPNLREIYQELVNIMYQLNKMGITKYGNAKQKIDWYNNNMLNSVGDKKIYIDDPVGQRPAAQQPAAQGVKEAAGQQLSLQQLATISDEALDNAYHYGRSSPGNTFGWQANLKSAAYAAKMINAGVTDIEKISDAIHKGWNVTAQAFVQNPEQFADTEKLRQAGKLEAKLQQRAQLMKQNYAQLPEEEKEKDRVVARALLQAITGQKAVAEVAPPPGAKAERMVKHIKKGYAKDGKLTPKEKSIAYATTWKAHNAGKLEEENVADLMKGYGPQMYDKIKNASDDQLWDIATNFAYPSYQQAGSEYEKLSRIRDHLLGPDAVVARRSQGIQSRADDVEARLAAKRNAQTQAFSQARRGMAGMTEESDKEAKPESEKERQWRERDLAAHKRKLAQDDNRRKMAPKPMEETMGGTVAGAVAPAPGAKTFAEASSESHTAEWKAAGKAVHAILKKLGYKGAKTEKGYMWTKQTPKGTAFVDIDFDERDPEVVAWGEGELKGAKDKSYWQSGSGNIGEIADKIAELFANVKPGEAPKEMDEADKDGKKPDADKDGVPDWADKKPGKDDNDESEDKDDSKESDDKDGDNALKKMKKDAGVDKDEDKEKSDDKDDDKDDDKEESDSDDKDDDKEEKSESKDKSGTPYGQSVYESLFNQQMSQLNESISMNTSQDDNGNKSVTVTATEEDADKLGEMLKMAGLFSSGGYEEVEAGADHVDEDLANAPDETYSDMDTILNKLSGGLNGPKTTGQTTAPVINRDVRRQGPSVKTTVTDIKEETESKLWNLYKKYDNK